MLLSQELMLFGVFGKVFVLPFGVNCICGMFVASPIMRTLNLMMADPKAPLLFTDKHSLKNCEIKHPGINKSGHDIHKCADHKAF